MGVHSQVLILFLFRIIFVLEQMTEDIFFIGSCLMIAFPCDSNLFWKDIERSEISVSGNATD